MPVVGGVGHSWFEVELTSEHVCIPGDGGGVGTSWFCVELTSDHVPDDGVVTPVHPPSSNLVRRKRVVRDRQVDRFEGTYWVVKTAEDRFSGRLIGYKPSRFAGVFEQVESTTQTFSATYSSSTMRAIRLREEEEIPFLLDDE